MKLTLKSKGFHAEKILIDDKALNRVTHIEIIADGRKPPKAIIELIPDEIEVDGEFEVITQAGYATDKFKGGNLLWKMIRKLKNKKQIKLIRLKQSH